jgi:TROVE domain
MSKFNRTKARTTPASPIATAARPTGRTYEGAAGYARDAKSELFLLAVANMVGEGTFYERAGERDERYERLVHEIAVADARWMLGFLGWLRSEANMRSASLVGAAEAVKARLVAGAESGEVTNRKLVDSVLRRADEPGEMLGYWTGRYGRALPKPVKRGVADAVLRLYTERTLLKYDTDAHAFRFGDVIDLVHPSTDRPWQGELFRYALDRRHGNDNGVPEQLPMIALNRQLRMADNVRALLTDPDRVAEAGMTWEDVLSLAGSGVDKARLWTAVMPSMGLMALARNLRNFDQARVSDEVAANVAARFADPEQVARSRMLPFRWLAAYRSAPSLRWGHALDRALTASLANVPALPGRTLILVDVSGSMASPAAGRLSEMNRYDAAAVFGAALAMRAADPTLVWFGTSSGRVPVARGGSLLKLVESVHREGRGTNTAGAVRQWYARHDRVVILTDEQAAYSGPGDVAASVPASIPVYTWNLAGYRRGHAPSGTGNRHTFGGLSDTAFRLIPLLERGVDAGWPWEVA